MGSPERTLGEKTPEPTGRVTNPYLDELRRRALSPEQQTSNYAVNVDRTLVLHAVDIALHGGDFPYSDGTLRLFGEFIGGDVDNEKIYGIQRIAVKGGVVSSQASTITGELSRAGFINYVTALKKTERTGIKFNLENIPDLSKKGDSTTGDSADIPTDLTQASTPDLLNQLKDAVTRKVKKTEKDDLRGHLLLARALNLLTAADDSRTFEASGNAINCSFTNTKTKKILFDNIYRGVQEGELEDGLVLTQAQLQERIPGMSKLRTNAQIAILREAGVITRIADGMYLINAKNIPAGPGGQEEAEAAILVLDTNGDHDEEKYYKGIRVEVTALHDEGITALKRLVELTEYPAEDIIEVFPGRYGQFAEPLASSKDVFVGPNVQSTKGAIAPEA